VQIGDDAHLDYRLFRHGAPARISNRVAHDGTKHIRRLTEPHQIVRSGYELRPFGTTKAGTTFQLRHPVEQRYRARSPARSADVTAGRLRDPRNLCDFPCPEHVRGDVRGSFASFDLLWQTGRLAAGLAADGYGIRAAYTLGGLLLLLAAAASPSRRPRSGEVSVKVRAWASGIGRLM